MIRLLLFVTFVVTSLFAKEYTLNFKGIESKENFMVKVQFEVDEDSKPLAAQKIDVRNIEKY